MIYYENAHLRIWEEGREKQEERGEKAKHREVNQPDPAGTPECNSHSRVSPASRRDSWSFSPRMESLSTGWMCGEEGMQAPRYFQLSLQMRCLQQPEGKLLEKVTVSDISCKVH